MSLLDLCHRFKAASNVKPPSREEVEKRVEKAIKEEMEADRLRSIKTELEHLAPNPHKRKLSHPAYINGPYDHVESAAYDEALNNLAEALAKELP